MTTPDTSTLPISEGAFWRRGLEYIVPALAVAVVVVTPWVYWDRLPDPVATHWGSGGAPDDSGSLLLNVIMIAVITALAAFGPLIATRAPMPRVVARTLVGMAWGISSLFVMVRLYSLEANADAANWEDAGLLTGSMMAVAFGVALATGLIGAWVAGDRSDVARATLPAEAMEVQPGEAIVWASGAAGRVSATLAPVLLGLGVVGFWLVPGGARYGVGAGLALAALVLGLLGQCRVVVGPAGIRVRLGWFGWPSISVRTADIATVSVENINPAAYGGWGVRYVPGATAVVMRGGEGIRVERVSGRALVVSVDDAAVGAGVLAAHLTART